MNKLKTKMKIILVFEHGELTKQIAYKTKNDTIKNYRGFLKHGISNPSTGEKIANVKFELL